MASASVAVDYCVIKSVAPVMAFRIPVSRRILQVSSAIVYCFLSAGIVFGYAAIKPVLVAEGVYRDRCTPDEVEQGLHVCFQQEMKLNMIFTVAAVATNVCAVVVGVVLDRYGPRFTAIIGSILLALGCLGFSISSTVTVIDPYPISYLFLALAGPFIFISSMNLANTFPRHSGLILSLLTGAFDSSPAVFLVYRLLYQSALGPVSLQIWFTRYLIVPLVIPVVQFLIMPSRSYETPGEVESNTEAVCSFLDEDNCSAKRSNGERYRASDSETVTLLVGPTGNCEADARDKGIYGAMYGKDIKTQFSSYWFWAIVGFTIIQMLRTNYFVATIRAQYEFLLHSYDNSVAINRFFDAALPLGGLLATPFIGIYLDTFSLLTIIYTLVVCSTIVGILGLVQHSIYAAYLNVMIFVIYRPFYYTVVSDYCAKIFGVATFGKVYGAVVCISGILNLFQATLDMITFQWCDGDPRPVNFLLLVLGLVVGITLAGYVKFKGDEARRKGKTPSVDNDIHNGTTTRYATIR